MIHYISSGDIPAIGATVLSLGDGDAWLSVAPADPRDLAAVDVPTYEERGIVGAADLPWVDAVVPGPHAHTGAPTAADWQRILEDVEGAAVMVACLPACWVGESMSTTSGWIAVARETLQSEVEYTLAMAGEPAACVCAACRGASRAGAAVAWPPVGAICVWCGDPADMVCRGGAGGPGPRAQAGGLPEEGTGGASGASGRLSECLSPPSEAEGAS